MKRLFYLIFLALALCAGTDLFAQTEPLELDFLTKAVANGEMEQKIAEYRLRRFKELRHRPDYPKLPFDTITRMYDVSFTYACPGMTKTNILTKIDQWSRARFMRPGAGVQQIDTASGLVLVMGYADLRVANISLGWISINLRTQFVECKYMLQLRAADGALIGKLVNVEYVFTRVVSSDSCQTVLVESRTMGSLTPFTAQEHYRLEGLVNLFISTADMLHRTETDVVRFIKN